MVVERLPYFHGPSIINHLLEPTSTQPTYALSSWELPRVHHVNREIYQRKEPHKKSPISLLIFKLTPELFYHKLK